MKIKISIEHMTNNSIELEILKMNEQFRCKDEVNIFYASNGFRIRSDFGGPTISEDELCVWGSIGRYDNHCAFIKFDNKEECYKFIIRLKSALIEWSKNWKWIIPESKIVDCSSGPFTV